MATDDDIQRAPLRAHILASINPFVAEKKKYSSRRRETSSHSRPRDKAERRHRAEEALHDANEKPTTPDEDKLRPRGGKLRFKRKRDGADDQDRSRRKTGREDYGYDDDREDEAERDLCRDRVDHGRHDQEEEGDARAREKDDETPGHDRSRSRSREHRHRHRHHRTKWRRSRTPSDERRRRRRREEGTEEEEEDPYAEPPLDPDAAFRQSLFDAMADDEGAEYWEGVYGQPVHEYAREAAELAAEMGGGGGGPGGSTLEAMTDDQYAEYVRRCMWERSDEGIREARRAQKRAREQAEKEARAKEAQARRAKAAAEEARLQREADEKRSRRRAAALRSQNSWQDRWRAYGVAWTAWDAAPSAATIPWPSAADADAQDPDQSRLSGEALVAAARAFFAGHEDGAEDELPSLARRLRDERVRWHPDKIQQRLGGRVDAAVLRDVTAVFQVVDDLWSATRQK